MRVGFIVALSIISMSTQAHIAVQSRTAGIYHRFYLIKRLEQSCELLRKPTVQQLIPFESLDASLYVSESIKAVVEQMKLEKNTNVFFELWHDFCTYKHIYDESFKNELVALIYALYNCIYANRMKKYGDSLEHVLFAIDCAHDSRYSINRSLKEPQQELAEVTTDYIAKRFYILKRLQKCMKYLEFLHAKDFRFTDSGRGNRFVDEMMKELENFQHDRVRESIFQMYHRKNLEPLLLMCNETKQYRFVQDENFLQEMLMNIFLVYKTILLKNGLHNVDPMIIREINHVLEIYEHLSTMPLDQTLEAIDEVTDRLIAIQVERTARPAYMRWAIVGAIGACIGSGAYYYFLHRNWE